MARLAWVWAFLTSPDIEESLCRCEFGRADGALAAIGHGEMPEGLRRFRFPRGGDLEFADRPVRVADGEQGLPQHNADRNRPKAPWRRPVAGGHGLAGATALQEGLTLQFMKIGVARLLGEKPVDARQGLRQPAAPMGQDGPGIARSGGGVGRWIARRTPSPAARRNRRAWLA